MTACDFLIVGGGTAGMTAACVLRGRFPHSEILLLEREEHTGGILRQCIHHGFGTDDLTGPEYAARLQERFRKAGVSCLLQTEAAEIRENGEGLTVVAASPEGWTEIRTGRLLLATGCYERPIGNLWISGTRPAGIFGAGELQRKINLEGYQPGRTAVVIGSGDIGLIIARRLTLCGCEVKRIVEVRDKSPALEKNKKSCLRQYGLPLQLHARVVKIHGAEQLQGVTIRDQMSGQEESLSCEMLVVAAGLIPDRMLTDMLSEEAKKEVIYLGNCDRIFSMADGIVRSVAEKLSREVLFF